MCRLRPAMPCSLWLRASLAVAALSCCWLRCEAAIPTAGPQHVVPGNGSYFGVTMDFGDDTVASYTARLGFQPAVYNLFLPLPLLGNTTEYLQTVLPQISQEQAIAMLTVMPMEGLSAVTETAVAELAYQIQVAQEAGASVMIRFAHEMNGNWYPWGQQPLAYIAAWKLVHNALANLTCSVTMVWAPNTAIGYPWRVQDRTEENGAEPGSADYAALDTNGDGHLNSKDDPFEPYYPGDEYVEWVGLSVDHFGGSKSPYNRNLRPSAREFTDTITGKLGNVPNFYNSYSNDTVHQKPLCIAETTAMYIPGIKTGDTNFTIKSKWWEQVFNVQGDSVAAVDMSVHFPMIKMVLWFDEYKYETAVQTHNVDWRFSRNSTLLKAFTKYLEQPVAGGPFAGQRWWKLLSDFRAERGALDCAGQDNTSISIIAAGAPLPPSSDVNAGTYASGSAASLSQSIGTTAAVPTTAAAAAAASPPSAGALQPTQVFFGDSSAPSPPPWWDSPPPAGPPPAFGPSSGQSSSPPISYWDMPPPPSPAPPDPPDSRRR